MLLEGNAGTLTSHFQHLLGKKDIRLTIFGSHQFEDVQTTFEFNEHLKKEQSEASWEAIVVEEFGGKGGNLNYFGSQIEEVARYQVTNIHQVKDMLKSTLRATRVSEVTSNLGLRAFGSKLFPSMARQFSGMGAQRNFMLGAAASSGLRSAFTTQGQSVAT